MFVITDDFFYSQVMILKKTLLCLYPSGLPKIMSGKKAVDKVSKGLGSLIDEFASASNMVNAGEETVVHQFEDLESYATVNEILAFLIPPVVDSVLMSSVLKKPNEEE